MYEILMDLPMFRGVTLAKLTEVVEHVKLHFLKLIDGQTIVNAGDPCTHLNFIISGSVRSTVATTDERFKVSQTLTAPGVLAPDFLFGRATTFPCTAKAIGTVSLLQINKQDFIDILKSDDIFLFNYINYVSMNAQKAIQGVLAVAAGSLEERIAFWIIALTQPAGTDITLTCRQRDLYALFGVQRSSFIATLDRMKEQGIIDYTSGEISIKSRRELLNVLTNHSEWAI